MSRCENTLIYSWILLRLTYFSPIESESMVGDGLPPTPNSKNTLQTHSVNTIKFISIPAQAVFCPWPI